MKNAKTVFQDLIAGLTLAPEEARATAWLLLEHYLKLSKTDVMAGKVVALTPYTSAILQKAVHRVNRGEPVQYVLGIEYFLGRGFQVNPSVLIPRPETEEVVRVVLSFVRDRSPTPDASFRLLDIGTGTGCIPIVLALQLPGTEVFATDISTAALSVAVHNAGVHHVDITFIEHDILKEDLPVGDLDIVVSNPPYIAESERAAMDRHVVEHEPHQALFVSDEDPLVFYRHIADKASRALRPGGLLAVEINERFGDAVSDILRVCYDNVYVVHDASGKDRVVAGIKRTMPTNQSERI